MIGTVYEGMGIAVGMPITFVSAMPRTGVDPFQWTHGCACPPASSGVKANVLFFDKHALRADGKPNTKELQFRTNRNFTLEKKPLKAAQSPCLQRVSPLEC
jgi:hypothetical protein